MTFHDPLAAATIFNDAICTFAQGNVEVELAQQGMAGKTLWDTSSKTPHHEVAVKVEPERFFEEYFRVF